MPGIAEERYYDAQKHFHLANLAKKHDICVAEHKKERLIFARRKTNTNMETPHIVISQPLRTYIESNIIPQYAAFDKAHQINHAQKVIDESLKLALHYDVNPNMVYAIAAYHDLGLHEGREHHHTVSGTMLMADPNLTLWFTPEELQIMKEAVEDHRASNHHAPRSIYGKIVAEADRIIDPEVTLLRTVQYGLANHPHLNKEEQYARFCQHLSDKYAPGGYLKLWIPESDNALKLNRLRELIADSNRLHEVFEGLYEGEKNHA